MTIKFLNSEWKSLLESSSLVMVLKILGALGGYAFVWAVINVYGSKSYGVFEVAFTFLSILATLSKWGSDGIMMREIAKMNRQEGWDFARKIQSFVGISSFLIGVILFFSANSVEEFLNEDGLAYVLRLVAFTLPFFSLFQIHSEYLRARKNWLLYGVFQTSFFLGLISILVYVLPEFKMGPMGFLLGVSILAFISIRRNGPLFINSWPSLKVYAPSATSMFLTGALFMIMSWSDTLALSYFLDAEDVANYRVAFKIATLITFTQFAVNAQIAPQISALWSQQKRTELQSLIYRASLINTIIGIPLFLVLVFFGEWFLSIFGEGFESLLHILRILSFGQVVNALCGPVMYILNMTGNENHARNTMVGAVILNITANIIFIPIYGLLGAAWATSCSMILWNIWALIVGYRRTGIRTLIFWR